MPPISTVASPVFGKVMAPMLTDPPVFDVGPVNVAELDTGLPFSELSEKVAEWRVVNRAVADALPVMTDAKAAARHADVE
jgi:hypothetical protein